MENILKIFNSDDKAELKQAFKEILIEQFRNEIEESRDWIFDSEQMKTEIENIMEELMYEVKDEFKGKLKKKLYEVLDKRF